MERRRYRERPPRYEYVLTERGREFRSVIVAMYAWGNKHFAPEGASVVLVQASTGLIETWFVSRLGTDALAGMALVFPGFMMSASVRLLVAIGGGWIVLQLKSSLLWLFAALALGLIVYGTTLTAAIASGVWFARDRRSSPLAFWRSINQVSAGASPP
jgi:hypothetical protein